MSAQFYDNALRETYRVPGASLTGGAAVLDRVIGPAGKRGRVVNVSHVVTTGVTVAASTVTIDTNAGVTTPVAHTVPISSADAGAAIAAASLAGQTELPADTVVEIQTDGASTAGAVDLVVTIDWF
jgi:hypothetical protein